MFFHLYKFSINSLCCDRVMMWGLGYGKGALAVWWCDGVVWCGPRRPGGGGESVWGGGDWCGVKCSMVLWGGGGDMKGALVVCGVWVADRCVVWHGISRWGAAWFSGAPKECVWPHLWKPHFCRRRPRLLVWLPVPGKPAVPTRFYSAGALSLTVWGPTLHHSPQLSLDMLERQRSRQIKTLHESEVACFPRSDCLWHDRPVQLPENPERL